MTQPETAQQWHPGLPLKEGDADQIYTTRGHMAPITCDEKVIAAAVTPELRNRILADHAQAQALGEVVDALVAVVMHIDDGGACDCTANAIKLIKQYGKPEDVALLDTMPPEGEAL